MNGPWDPTTGMTVRDKISLGRVDVQCLCKSPSSLVDETSLEGIAEILLDDLSSGRHRVFRGSPSLHWLFLRCLHLQIVKIAKCNLTVIDKLSVNVLILKYVVIEI